MDRLWWLIPAVLIIVLILWGPGKLPEVGQGMGRAIREFRNAMSGAHDTMVDATSVPASPVRPPDTASPGPAPTPSEQPPATVPDDTRPR
ncbi:MAG: twin-arginine translocase TatA/TatE family subunit [Candidatus Dormiibacterota bacterium]